MGGQALARCQQTKLSEYTLLLLLLLFDPLTSSFSSPCSACLPIIVEGLSGKYYLFTQRVSFIIGSGEICG